MDVIIDVQKLRDYLLDYCGTAVFGGFPGAMVDVLEIENLDGWALCRKAEELGVDLRPFVIGRPGE